MKYIRLIVMLIVILAEYGICYNVDPPCKSEIDTEIKNSCTQKTNIGEMAMNYFGYRDNRINRADFKELVDKYCGKLLTETECVLNKVLPTITDVCNSSAYYDTVLVQNRYHQIFSEYFCANNQTRYMDTIEDDGVNCLFNYNYASCFYGRVLPADEFTSEGICGLLDTNIACENHFDDCLNQHIKSYRAELFRLLKQKFNC